MEYSKQFQILERINHSTIIYDAGYKLYAKVRDKIICYIEQMQKETNNELQKILLLLQHEFDEIQFELHIKLNTEYKEYVRQKHYEHNSEWIRRVEILKKQYDVDRTLIINANSSDIIARKREELRLFKNLKENEYKYIVQEIQDITNCKLKSRLDDYVKEQEIKIEYKRHKIIDMSLQQIHQWKDLLENGSTQENISKEVFDKEIAVFLEGVDTELYS